MKAAVLCKEDFKDPDIFYYLVGSLRPDLDDTRTLYQITIKIPDTEAGKQMIYVE